jgi:hypothetical protein
MFTLYVQLTHIIKWSQLHVPAAMPPEEGVPESSEWEVGFPQIQLGCFGDEEGLRPCRERTTIVLIGAITICSYKLLKIKISQKTSIAY